MRYCFRLVRQQTFIYVEKNTDRVCIFERI